MSPSGPARPRKSQVPRRTLPIIQVMATNPDRLCSELDEVERELLDMSGPRRPGLNHWRHKMTTLIAEITGPTSALAEQFALLRWEAAPARCCATSATCRRQCGTTPTKSLSKEPPRLPSR